MKRPTVPILLVLSCLVLMAADAALATRCCQTATGCFETESEELCESCGGELNFLGVCGDDGMCVDTAPNPASEKLACSEEEALPMATQIDINKLICRLIETPKSRNVGRLGFDAGSPDPVEPAATAEPPTAEPSSPGDR